MNRKTEVKFSKPISVETLKKLKGISYVLLRCILITNELITYSLTKKF